MSMPSPRFVDPSRCPLCGTDNDCGLAKGKGVCWCSSIKIPEEVLDRVRPEARGVACVCRDCATGRRSPAGLARQIKALTQR